MIVRNQGYIILLSLQSLTVFAVKGLLMKVTDSFWAKNSGILMHKLNTNVQRSWS